MTMDKQDMIAAILRALVAKKYVVERSHCGRYTILNYGPASYYDDLQFFLGEWRRALES
jgi:hypothetical protein